MDWTSVLEDTGEEDFLVQQYLVEPKTAPRLARLVSRVFDVNDDNDNEEGLAADHRLWELAETHHYHSSSSYTLQALYYLTINYILGVGCLGVPYAFARAGFMLCSIILIVVTTLSYITVMWVAETGVRLERISGSVAPSVPSLDKNKSSKNGTQGTKDMCMAGEQTPLQKRESLSRSTRIVRDVDIDRYEVVDLVSFYLGPFHKIVYQTSLLALMYVGLLAYTQVFCGAMSALIWGVGQMSDMAGMPQLVFGLIVVPLSCMELDEQVAVQSIMAMVRFAAIFIMVGGSVLALCLDDTNSLTTDSSMGLSLHQHAPYFAPEEPQDCKMSYTACFSGFGVAFSTALFSQLFQHSVPGLLRPLRNQTDKIKEVPRVFGASLLTTCFFYLLLGTTAASYFGANTLPSVNLNFSNFTFGLNVDAAITTATTTTTTASPRVPNIVWVLLKLASDVVVMFPALDTLSVFPLIANTLGSNLMAASGKEFITWIARHVSLDYRRKMKEFSDDEDDNNYASNSPYSRCRLKESHVSLEERKKLTQHATRVATIFWRLVAALPPLIGSLWATHLSFSLLLAGVAGLYVAFFAPSLLQLRSYRLDQERTVFSGWYSWTGWAYPTIGFALFSLAVVLVQIQEAWRVMHPMS